MANPGTIAATTDTGQGAAFAVVNGAVISTAEFEGALNAAVRQKYYHRQPQEEQLAELRTEVTDRLVNRLLLLGEGRRRGIQPDEEKVAAEVAAFEKRNRDRPQWQESRAEVLPALTQVLREQSIITQLETAARVSPPPTEDQLRDYYTTHPDLFTEPERVRLSLIVLKVDPTATGGERDEAIERARSLIDQLRNGADFAELARANSSDASAREGGDLGYRHRGMLPAGVETEVDKMSVGSISEPFRLLEGIAVFKLADRRTAQLRSLENVRHNVAELWARDQGEAQWRGLLAQLRTGAEISVLGQPLKGGAGNDTRVSSQAAH